MVAALVAGGANPNAVDNRMRTALMLACKRGAANVVSALLQGDPDIHPSDEAGCTALSYASNAGHTAVVIDLLAAVQAE